MASDKLMITYDSLIELVTTKAVMDHTYPDDPEGREASEYSADLTPEQCKVFKVEFFDRVYAGTPDDIGTVELQYHSKGYRAIYGFGIDGSCHCYAD